MKILTALLSGLLFGLGLIITGMTNPNKILAFLDITGQWDPSLMLAMISAMLIAFLAFHSAKRQKISLLGLKIVLPTLKNIDKRLLIGSILFGFGWGLAGICPGPALVMSGAGVIEILIFTAAMITGMILFELLPQSQKK